MTGVLLNSGNLRDYTALGDEGQPVYSVASQLREVIRARVGVAAANCLAIPKVNDGRATVDWYASRSGAVVPWSAATPMEQAVALESLDRYREGVIASLGAISGVSDRELQIVQNLKDKVFAHPDNSCVFLVDGEPVLTFWGFHSGEAPLADPFYNLRPPPVAMPAAAAPIGATAAGMGGGAAAAAVATRRPWWHWLLLALLLLALLFFLLRACSPSASLNLPGLPGLGVKPLAPQVDVRERDVTLSAPKVSEPPVRDLAVTGADQRLNRVDLSGRVSADSTVELPTLDGSTALGMVDPAQTGVVEDPDKLALDAAALAPSEGVDAGQALPETIDAGQSQTPDATEPVDHTLMPDMVPPTLDSEALQVMPEAAPQMMPQASVDPGAVASGTASAPLGQPMQIPAEAAQSGSVSFLDGRWRAAGGIQDANTGQPVRLWYEFKDGKGSVTVEKAEGVRCQTDASPQMASGKLLITAEGGLARCTDGTSIALPTISCTPSQSGQANCTGVTSDGKPLPIMIRQSP